MSNRAERRLCAKAKHPYRKIMPDGSLVCSNCGTHLKPPPLTPKTDKRV